MNRFQAFAIHLALSLAIFVVLAYLVVIEWYPSFFFDTDGGWRGLRIIVFVDLVLGPALTLVVYKHGKPGLKTDLTIIGVVQMVCLVAGTYIVYSERPQVMVYNDSRFSVMGADDYTSIGLQTPNLRNFPGDNPKWVMVVVPEEVQEEADFRSKIFKSGQTINTAVDLYQPFDFNHHQVKEQPEDPESFFAKPNRQAALKTWLEKNDYQQEDLLFYNIAARFVYGALALDKHTGEPVGVIEFTQPKEDQ